MRQEYRVLAAPTTFSLSQQVNKYLNEGWIVVGGVAVGDDEYSPAGRGMFYQAIHRFLNDDVLVFELYKKAAPQLTGKELN